MIEAGRGIQPLLESSLDLYRELIEREGLRLRVAADEGCCSPTGRRTRWTPTRRPTGCLANRSTARRSGTTATPLLELEPALKPGLAGGWYYHDDAHLRPDKLMRSWREVLEAGGVTIRENCGFRGFRRQHGHAVAAVTEQEELAADAFVVATGAWTPMLNDRARLQGADPAGQGLQPDHAPARRSAPASR